jgi:hypothetical protein
MVYFAGKGTIDWIRGILDAYEKRTQTPRFLDQLQIKHALTRLLLPIPRPTRR